MPVMDHCPECGSLVELLREGERGRYGQHAAPEYGADGGSPRCPGGGRLRGWPQFGPPDDDTRLTAPLTAPTMFARCPDCGERVRVLLRTGGLATHMVGRDLEIPNPVGSGPAGVPIPPVIRRRVVERCSGSGRVMSPEQPVRRARTVCSDCGRDVAVVPSTGRPWPHACVAPAAPEGDASMPIYRSGHGRMYSMPNVSGAWPEMSEDVLRRRSTSRGSDAVEQAAPAQLPRDGLRAIHLPQDDAGGAEPTDGAAAPVVVPTAVQARRRAVCGGCGASASVAAGREPPDCGICTGPDGEPRPFEFVS